MDNLTVKRREQRKDFEVNFRYGVHYGILFWALVKNCSNNFMQIFNYFYSAINQLNLECANQCAEILHIATGSHALLWNNRIFYAKNYSLQFLCSNKPAWVLNKDKTVKLRYTSGSRKTWNIDQKSTNGMRSWKMQSMIKQSK